MTIELDLPTPLDPATNNVWGATLNAAIQQVADGVVPVSGSGSLGGAYLKTVSDIINGESVDVLRAIPRAQHGAILDGVSTYDVTADIQDLVSDVTSGTLVYPRGNYVQGNVRIENKTGLRLRGDGGIIQLTGAASGVCLGFQLVGSVEDLEVSGLRIVGDGDKTHKHAGIWSESGQDLANVRVHHNYISDVMIGVTLNANLSGSIVGFEVTDNIIEDVVGIAAGQGYGIHVAFLDAGSARGLIARNRISRAKRHGIYVARAADVDVIGNHIFDHRSTLTSPEQSDGTDGSNRYRPAIFIARSKRITVQGNTIADFRDGGLQLDCNPNAEAGVVARDVTIRGNVFRQPLNNIQSIVIGSISPATTGYPEDVEVAENALWADYTGLTGVTSQDGIVHYAGKNVRYRDNRITIRGTNAGSATYGINVIAHGETAGTSLYNDDLTFQGNLVHATNGTGTSGGLRVASTLTDASARVEIAGNDATGAAAALAYAPIGTVTNPNYRVRSSSGGCAATYVAGDTAPSVARGVTVLPVTNASATSITALDDGMDGQRVDLIFGDANTTLVNGTNLRLVGGANFTPTVRDVIGFVRQGGTWYQSAPVSNN